MDGTDGAGVSVSALVAHHSDGHHRQEHRKGLPDLVVESGSFDFRNHDIVRFLEECYSFRSYLAKDTNCQTGAGEWLALKNLFRHTQFTANAPDLILKEIL